MNHVTVSAPGKLMLFGEHAVVYGFPCIVTAVGQRMSVAVEFLDDPSFILDAKDVKISGYKKSMSDVGSGEIPKGAQFIEQAVKNFMKISPCKKGLKVTTTSEFSSQFGFGSSSASTVCMLKALSELSGVGLSNKELFDLSYDAVLAIQGKGSGFDVAAAIYGGTVYFVTGGKSIEPLVVKNLPLVIGYTGVKADTVTLINDVKKKMDAEPEKVKRIFAAIANIVGEAKGKVTEGDWERIGTLMNFDQEYLRDLGVSTEKLENLIAAAKNAGAYGAKLSGAGGGDCMITVVAPDKKEVVSTALANAGGTVLPVSVNAEGVRVEI